MARRSRSGGHAPAEHLPLRWMGMPVNVSLQVLQTTLALPSYVKEKTPNGTKQTIRDLFIQRR